MSVQPGESRVTGLRFGRQEQIMVTTRSRRVVSTIELGTEVPLSGRRCPSGGKPRPRTARPWNGSLPVAWLLAVLLSGGLPGLGRAEERIPLHPSSLPSADASSALAGTSFRGVQAQASLTPADRAVLGGWHANLLRWPLRCPQYDPNKVTDYDAWIDCAIQGLVNTLPELQQDGLYVVVNMADTPGGRDANANNLIFTSSAARAKYIAAWQRVAQRLAGQTRIWAYDLANEPIQPDPSNIPAGLTDWHTLATEVAKEIRKIDTATPIVVEPGTSWASPVSFNNFAPIGNAPGDVANVVYSVHMYDPGCFTHQRITSLRNVPGYPCPTQLVSYPGPVPPPPEAGVFWDEDRMRLELEPVRRFQQTYNVPIYVGEFSAVRWAPNDSARNYLSDAIDLFEEYGWNWTYHAFREFDGWDVELNNDPNDYNRTTTTRQILLQSWFCKNSAPVPCPVQVSVKKASVKRGPTTGNTRVVITGTNFDPGARPFFGDVLAKGWTVDSSSQITAVTSAHAAGYVNITVLNSDSKSARRDNAFQYIDLPPVYQGYVDLVTCDSIAGWAWDQNYPTTPISVDVYDNGTRILTVPADAYRGDLKNAGIGDGYHAFWVPTPPSLKNGVAHTVDVRFAGTTTSLTASPRSLSCCLFGTVAAPPLPADVVWVDEQIPAGAVAVGTWTWDTGQKVSGSTSNTEPASAGTHQHYFYGATTPLSVAAGDKLVAYVLLDPCNPVQELMLQWNNGSWEHRAYWGQDLIPWGAPGTGGHVFMGALPAAGQWVRLEVAGSTVGLKGAAVNGMAFTLYGGRAWFDRAGLAHTPVDGAAFMSQAPPPSCMWPGSTAAVSVTMKNTGNTDWDWNYRLGSQNPQDNQTWGLGRVFLQPGQTVPPQQTKTFSFSVTAPSAPGTYNFQWLMVHEMLRWFGDYTPNVIVTNTTPPAPSGLWPNWTSLPSGTTSVRLSWNPTFGATRYAVRLQDNTDGSLKSIWSCPGAQTIYLCVNDVATTSYTATVVPGHSYTWWVHAGNCIGYGTQTYGGFSVAAEGLHPPTNLRYEGFPSRNLLWTPPDNLTSADQVRYDLWLYGPSCPSGCEFIPGAPSWYTLPTWIQSGSYGCKLQAISASRSSSGFVNGAAFGYVQLNLSINRTTFHTTDRDWAVTVNSTLVSSGATLIEEFWNGSSWQEDWRGGIGQIPSSGVLTFVDGAPYFAGSFRSHVEAVGSLSNYVSYSVSN